MIIAGTGHRSDKLNAPGYPVHFKHNPLRLWVREQIKIQLRALRPLYVISGLAIGFDQDLAEVSVEMGIPYIAAVPFLGQEARWPQMARIAYRELLKLAYEVHVIWEGGYSRDAMTMRNHWMVDHCNVLLACFDGSAGGTANTVLYADRVGREKIRIDPNDFRRQVTA